MLSLNVTYTHTHTLHCNGWNVVTLGCSTDTDIWGIQWPSTANGSTAVHDCYMSKGTYVSYIYMLLHSCKVYMWLLYTSKFLCTFVLTATHRHS